MMLQLDTKARDRAFDLLGAKNATKASVRALNRSIASSRTMAVSLVRQDMGLKSSVVRERITVMKATPSKQVARLAASNERIHLIEFNARGRYPSRGRGTGVRAKLPPPGKGTYPHAFIAFAKNSGKKLVLERYDAGGRKGARGPRGGKTYALRGPSVARSFTRNGQAIQARAEEVLQKNFDHEVEFLASQATQ